MSVPLENFQPNGGVRILGKGYLPSEPSRPIMRSPVLIRDEPVIMSNQEALSALSLPFVEDFGESCLSQYMHYLHGYRGNICDDSRAVLDRNQHLRNLMEEIARYREIVSLGSLLLYDEACSAAENESYDGNRKHHSWYKDTIDHCAEAFSHISGFTDGIKKHTPDPAFSNFIDDFRREIELLIIDTVNLATGTAAHLTRSDCAVFIGELPVHVPEKANFGNILSLFGEHSKKGQTVYDTYLRGSLDYLREKKDRFSAGEPDRTISFPALVSAFDTAEFASLLNSFLAEAESGLSIVTYNPQSDTFKLGEEIELSVKPNGSRSAQPRINFKGIERFKGFSLRIDKEDSRVAMDIGGYGYATLIKIAEAIAKATQNGESIMDYPDLVRDEDYRISSRVLYTPVNQNPAMPKISQGEFMAYVAAFCMGISHDMLIRKSASFYSYHSRTFLATDPDHHTHFAANATTLHEIMTQLSAGNERQLSYSIDMS